MDERADELLMLWGEWMRRAPGVPRLGYPSSSIGGHLIGRRPVNERQAARIALVAQRSTARTAEGELVQHMVPLAQPKQTRAGSDWQPTEWPPIVDEVERVIAQMTRREQHAVRLRYMHQMSQAEAAQAMGVSVSLYKRIVAEAQRFFAGYLSSMVA